MTVLVHVNDCAYVVEDSGLPDVEALVLDAVHSGGAFIDLYDRASRPVRVLVSGASAVRIEKVPHQLEPADDDDLFPDFASYDFEL